MLGLQHIAGAGERQRHILVGDQHHGFQPAQIAIGAPILGEIDAGARQLIGVLFELGFQALQQREGVSRGARKACDHIALAEPAHLLGVALHDGLAKADLPVAGDHDLVALAHGDDRRAVHDDFVWHGKLRIGGAHDPYLAIMRTPLVLAAMYEGARAFAKPASGHDRRRLLWSADTVKQDRNHGRGTA